MPAEAAYSIADLARLTGVTVRTIRYYLAQGLLPASGETGPGAHYGEGHLHRLLLTKRLQEQHLPLAEIRRRLAELTDAEVASVVTATLEPEREISGSALDYVRSVLGTAPALQPGASLAGPGRTPAPAAAAGATTSAAPALASSSGMVLPPQLAFAASKRIAAEAPAMPPSAPIPDPTEPPGPERSQWERLSMGPNVEIHIRRPLSRPEQRRVERLITIARQVLKEDNR